MTTYIEPLVQAYETGGITGLNAELDSKDYGPMTLAEIGQILNVSRERVRQVQDQAIKKLSNPKFGRRLKHYIEDYSQLEACNQDIGRDAGRQPT